MLIKTTFFSLLSIDPIIVISYLQNFNQGAELYFALNQVVDFGADYSKPDICQTYLRPQVRVFYGKICAT
jgi:hypothetical protein